MGSAAATIPIVIVSFVALVMVVYAFSPRIKGMHYTSVLTCSKCGHRFEYGWLPGGSFDSIRWGKYRLMRCPMCGQFSWFDIWTTKKD